MLMILPIAAYWIAYTLTSANPKTQPQPLELAKPIASLANIQTWPPTAVSNAKSSARNVFPY